MDALQELIAIEAIKKLKARYFRGVDTKDWDLLASTLSDDVVCDYRGATTDPETGVNAAPETTGDPLVGRKLAVDAIKSVLARVTTVHHGHMPEIEITGENTATGIWAMSDTLRFPKGGNVREVAAYGHYYETYVRIDGKWKIKALRLPRLRVDVTFDKV